MPESLKFQNMIDRRDTIAAIDIGSPVGPQHVKPRPQREAQTGCDQLGIHIEHAPVNVIFSCTRQNLHLTPHPGYVSPSISRASFGVAISP